MLRKILVLGLLIALALTGMAGAAMWDIKDIITGKQMVPADNSGAPWFADNSKAYFGTDKDAYLSWVSASGYLRSHGAQYFDDNATFAAGKTLTVPGGFVGPISGATITSLQQNDTAINSSISTLINAAYTNETAINSSIDSLTTATYTNETAINVSIANLLAADTGINTSIDDLMDNAYTNETAINVSITNLGAADTAINLSLDAHYTNETAINNSIVSLTTAAYTNETTINDTIADLQAADVGINASIARFSSTTTTATNFTILDTSPDFYFVGNSTTPNSQTITFPTAADNAGRVIAVMLTTDPGDNTVILKGEGAEKIDGADTKTTTDAVGSYYYLICDGTAWRKFNSAGTWT